MANWTISDELDTRLRERLGVEDPAAFAEQVIAERLDEAEDPEERAIVDAQIEQSEAELARGEGVDAREAMIEIADEFGINLDR
ncbi:MAG: hypothetical protein AAFY08_16125 [Planctomycetota bacterium]